MGRVIRSVTHSVYKHIACIFGRKKYSSFELQTKTNTCLALAGEKSDGLLLKTEVSSSEAFLSFPSVVLGAMPPVARNHESVFLTLDLLPF